MSSILVVDDDRMARHLIRHILKKAGFVVSEAADGVDALAILASGRFDLMLLDVWMPRMTGLELLERLTNLDQRPRVVVMTSDDAPETLLEAVRRQAFKYIHKPVEPASLIETVRHALEAPEPPRIEVISARPEWLELVVPCTRASVDRIEPVLAELGADLSPELQESTAYAFRELLMNAIEWGGELDPSRTVRISCLRARRMLLYRIADPGRGFDLAKLPHAAVGQDDTDPTAHVQVREDAGLRPGGFGLLTVRASVDELLYNERRNEVVFVKYLDPDA